MIIFCFTENRQSSSRQVSQQPTTSSVRTTTLVKKSNYEIDEIELVYRRIRKLKLESVKYYDDDTSDESDDD